MFRYWTTVLPLVYCELLLFAVVCVSLGQNSGSRSQCKVSQCSDEFNLRKELITDSSSKLQNCWALILYKRCCEKHKSSCWTDLNFRLAWRGIPLMMANYEHCYNVGLPEENVEDFYKTWTKEKKDTSSQNCAVKTESDHKLCAMYGDPHLWTFADDKQTCVIAGARSLIRKNKFLAVQVTNVEVPGVLGSKATATSKVTIVLYDYQKGCVQPKTYKATSGNLPSTFTDGRTQTGPKDSPARIYQLRHGKKIKIKINYISTTIIIRQVGKYLTFSMTMPSDLIGNSTRGLCVKGCPSHERIDYLKLLYGQDGNIETKSVKMVRRDAEKICKNGKTQGFYYSSCLFDLMTTGNINFSQAASTAMEDALHLKSNLDVTDSENELYLHNMHGEKSTTRTRSLATGRADFKTRQIYILTVVLSILLVCR